MVKRYTPDSHYIIIIIIVFVFVFVAPLPLPKPLPPMPSPLPDSSADIIAAAKRRKLAQVAKRSPGKATSSKGDKKRGKKRKSEFEGFEPEYKDLGISSLLRLYILRFDCNFVAKLLGQKY